jgi:ABC-type transporter Mla subunit MlaD
VTLIELLKAKWTFYGLDAPIFALLAAAGLILWTLLYQLPRLWWLVHRECRRHSAITKQLEAIGMEHGVNAREGLSVSAYDAIARVFKEDSVLRSAWRGFNAQIIMQHGVTGDDRFWASESAEGTFNEAAVIGRLNRGFFTAIPGVVTGIGLLITFLAILVALLDVRVVNDRVQGIELLIQGLSGKFVSSIAALLAATIFLVFEKSLFHRLANSRQRLVTTMDDLVPRLSPARILAALQQDIAEQSDAFRHFNADLSLKLRQGFSESMGPTLQRMVTTIDELNQLLRAAEAQRQDSLTSSLTNILHRLEQSLTTTLGDMSTRFTASLSGSARQEFDQVISSLGGTARLLEGMNRQSQTTLSALDELVTLARSSTAEQMALGKTQVEELTAVLRHLMTQLNETTGSSVTHMTAALTTVVHDLSTKVTELGQQMANTMMESAGQTTGAVHTVIQQADNWSRQSTEQLAQLLERHQSHLDQMVAVRTTLDATLIQFKEALSQYTTVTSNLRQISDQVSVMVTSAAGATKNMKDTTESVQRVVVLASTQIDRLAEANRKQEETWQRIQNSMHQYQQVFGQVETTAGDLFMQIGQHLQDYRETVKSGFEELIQLADGYFKNAVERLGGSVNELDDYLQELTDILEKFSRGGGNDGTQRR